MPNCKNPASQKYYYGRISREEAEKRLTEKGLKEGLFILRANMTNTGSYVLSIVHNRNIHHYSLELKGNNKIMIQDGKPFNGPVELIEHHKQELDGLLTYPKIPCDRDPGTWPMAWPNVSMVEFEKALLEHAEKMNLTGPNLETAFGPKRIQLVQQVSRKLHEDQKWFHRDIDRNEAAKRIDISGHENGKFLIRGRNDGSYALSLSYNNNTKHYKIDVRDSKFGIEDGPRFECIMDLVGHYYNRTDGLLCRLQKPCIRPNWRPRIYNPSSRQNGIYSGNRRKSSSISSLWEEPESPDISFSNHDFSHQELQSVYDSLPFDERFFKIPLENLLLKDELGKGFFGSVMKGMLNQNGKQVPVAVKTLIQDDVPHAKEEIMKEAKIMSNLRHQNVVRMIGICRTNTLMLVLELAPLGQLNKYLKKKQPRLSVSNLTEIVKQVAQGMEYLDRQNFVHRDLAARNVLLVSETFAKISDFGMSKALGIGENYYKTERAGKWPLKWYAPECIWFFKFDSKSDVWSFGVTMWEAFTYGSKPYRGMKGTEILEFIEAGDRLQQPECCPSELYILMLECWSQDPSDRPTFSEIVQRLREHQH